MEFTTIETKAINGVSHRYGYGANREEIYQELVSIVEQLEMERISEIEVQGEIEAILDAWKGKEFTKVYGRIKSICHITDDETILYPYLFRVFKEELELMENDSKVAIEEIKRATSVEAAISTLRWYCFEPKYEYKSIQQILIYQRLELLQSERLIEIIDKVEAKWKANQQQAMAGPNTSTSTLTNERDEAINEINTNHSLKQAFKMAKEGGLLDDNYQLTDRIKTFTQQALLADCIKIEANTNTSWQLFNKLWDIKDKNKIARQRSTTKEKIGKVRGQEIIFEVFKPQPHTNK